MARAGLDAGAVAPGQAAARRRSPCALECKLAADRRRSNDIDGTPIDGYVVFGQVVGVHIDERFIHNGLLDTAAMKPIARCGYRRYAVVRELSRCGRPKAVSATRDAPACRTPLTAGSIVNFGSTA